MRDLLALIKKLGSLNLGTTLVGGGSGLPVLAKGLGVSQYARTAASEGGYWVQFYWGGPEAIEPIWIIAGLSSIGFGYMFARPKKEMG